MHLADLLELRLVICTVSHVDIELRYIMQMPTRFIDHRLQIAQHLCVLSDYIARRSNLSTGIASILPRKEQYPSTCDKHSMIEAARRRQRFWIDKFMRMSHELSPGKLWSLLLLECFIECAVIVTHHQQRLCLRLCFDRRV